MPIPLSPLMGDLDPRACKLHCAVWDGEDHPIEVLARNWDEWVGWNRRPGARQAVGPYSPLTPCGRACCAWAAIVGGLMACCYRS